MGTLKGNCYKRMRIKLFCLVSIIWFVATLASHDEQRVRGLAEMENDVENPIQSNLDRGLRNAEMKNSHENEKKKKKVKKANKNKKQKAKQIGKKKDKKGTKKHKKKKNKKNKKKKKV